MISEISPILAMAMLGTPILLLVMLLPAIFELRKPRDAGPRLIKPSSSQVVAAPPMKVISQPDLDAHPETKNQA